MAPLPAACDAPAAAPAAPAAWNIEAEADFLTPGGVFAGDSVHFFSVVDAELAPNGNAVIALGRGQNTVIVLDASGSIVQVLGGAGDGPLELRGTPELQRIGGRVVVLDRTGRRHLDIVDDAFGDAVTYPRDAGQRELGLFVDGTMVTTQARRARSPESFRERQAVTPYYVRRAADVDTLDGPSSPPEAGFVMGRLANGGMVSAAAPACLPALQHVVADSTLVIADASLGAVMALRRTGAIDTLYQHTEPRGAVTQAMVDGAREAIAGAIANPPPSGSPEFDADAFMQSVGKVGDPLRSFWSGVLSDGQRLWLRRATPCFIDADAPAEPSLWDVIDIDSRARVAVAEVPADLRLLAVASDRVLGVSRDAFDVERVGVFRVVR